MSEEIDYAARVQRGIALMDVKWPAWATEIDLEKLDISSAIACMTAQYSAAQGAESHWRNGRLLLNLDMEAYERHGFVVDEDSDYAALNGLWKAEIERRRAQGQDAPAEPEATS
jgi:hypothetical protein